MCTRYFGPLALNLIYPVIGGVLIRVYALFWLACKSYLIRFLRDLYLEHQKRVILKEMLKVARSKAQTGKIGGQNQKKIMENGEKLGKKRNDDDLPQNRNLDYGLYNA